jgi:hypothetical protein
LIAAGLQPRQRSAVSRLAAEMVLFSLLWDVFRALLVPLHRLPGFLACRLVTVDTRVHAVAIILDLVQSPFARRRFVYETRELRLDPLG